MSSALRRRLSALQNLTVDRGATPGEAAAAREAERRIRDRLKASGTVLEWPEQEQADDYVSATRQRRTGRRKTAAERPKANRIRVGDILDLHRWCRCGRGHGRFEVLSAIELGHYGMLRCCGCGRNGGWLQREHFQNGGTHLME